MRSPTTGEHEPGSPQGPPDPVASPCANLTYAGVRATVRGGRCLVIGGA
jgi:hypothetical protein